MSFTTPIYIPLTAGLDLSKDQLLGGKELTIAENVDFAIQGEVRGRPGRAAPLQFEKATDEAAGTYAAAADFESLGLTSVGLMKHRDASGERALLGTQGRLFAKESTVWRDRGAFACWKVDRAHTYIPLTDTEGSSQLRRVLMGPTFGENTPLYSSSTPAVVGIVDPTTFSYQRTVDLVGTATKKGTMAKCGDYAATLFVNTSTNGLYLITRNGSSDALTETLLNTDAKTQADDGDAPCLASDGTSFFVVYQTTTANQYKVLKVTTAGSVSATYTGTLTGIHGHWVAAHAASSRVVVAVTNVDGLTMKVLNSSTMADLALDSTNGSVNDGYLEVVCGFESSTVLWWAARYQRTTSTSDRGLRIGTINPGSAASTSQKLTYYAADSVGYPTVTPVHQPILVNGRMYLTVGCYYSIDSTNGDAGTWVTVDLTNKGASANPTIVARGKQDGTAFAFLDRNGQPEGAVATSDGWTFPTFEYSRYDARAGGAAGRAGSWVLNQIAPSGPRAVMAQGSTLFSGSMPRILAGDKCFEHGFVVPAPVVSVTVDTGGSGTNTVGSYTIYACWAYTDGSGALQRSAPYGVTAAMANTTDYFTIQVSNPPVYERPSGHMKVEIYVTPVDPTSDDTAHLQGTYDIFPTLGKTEVILGDSTTALTITGEPLYTLSDEFQHTIPNADGGIAALGRRVWVASASTVYASLLLVPGEGVTWNDEGSLSVDLPAGAGRIVALEAMDDKLVVFCERGAYFIQDGGPDNVGNGSDIAYPIRLTDLGCAGPRSTCSTDQGVVFCSPLDSVDPQRGGPWLLDRSLTITARKYLGAPAMALFTGNGSWVPECAYSPERQQLYISVPEASSTGYVNTEGVVVIDMRTEKWSVWYTNQAVTALQSIAVVEGVLWDLRDRPTPYDQVPGSDWGILGTGGFEMRIATGHYASNGRDGLGWARVRSVSVLGGLDVTAHTLTMLAYQDGYLASNTSDSISTPTPAFQGTWPSSRPENEWRLPIQKCSTIKLYLSATPATARWSAIRLDVQPLPGRAPSGNRA